MLILTYHRITEAAPARFYENSVAQLRSHIDLLLEEKRTPFAIRSLGASEPSEDSFILTFDDATSDHFALVAGVLEDYAIPGVFFVPTERLGGSHGYLSEDEVRRLADKGHTIGCHSHEHRRMDTMDDGAQREQLEKSLEILDKLTGKQPLFFAPPGGFTNARLQANAQAMGLRALRTMQWGLNKPCRWMNLECLPANRGTNTRAVRRFLEGRNQFMARWFYSGKELLKKTIPMSAYARLRDRFLRG